MCAGKSSGVDWGRPLLVNIYVWRRRIFFALLIFWEPLGGLLEFFFLLFFP